MYHPVMQVKPRCIGKFASYQLHTLLRKNILDKSLKIVSVYESIIKYV